MFHYYDVSFYCYYKSGNVTHHSQFLCVDEIPNWIKAYQYTHPECIAISSKLWFDVDE